MRKGLKMPAKRAQPVPAPTKAQFYRAVVTSLVSSGLFVAWMMSVIVTGHQNKALSYAMYGVIPLILFGGNAVGKHIPSARRLNRIMRWPNWLVVAPVTVTLMVMYPGYIWMVGPTLLLFLFQNKLLNFNERMSEKAAATKSRDERLEEALRRYHEKRNSDVRPATPPASE